jgi:hypothetical protein
VVRFRIVRQLRHRGTHHRDERRVGVQATEHGVDEVVDKPSALVLRQPREFVHEVHLLGV